MACSRVVEADGFGDVLGQVPVQGKFVARFGVGKAEDFLFRRNEVLTIQVGPDLRIGAGATWARPVCQLCNSPAVNVPPLSVRPLSASNRDAAAQLTACS